MYLLNKRKTELVPSSEMKCRKSGIFNYYRWGNSGKAVLQVSIAVFGGNVEIFIGQRWLSSP